MKTLRLILFFFTAALAACTQNNGRIGLLFGSWHLESMSLNGKPFAQPEGTDTYWKFQGHVMQAILSFGPDDTDTRTGTWSSDDDVLTLRFTHGDDVNAPGTGGYTPPQWMGLDGSGIFELKILRLTGSSLSLSLGTADGVYTYTFSKTW